MIGKREVSIQEFADFTDVVAQRIGVDEKALGSCGQRFIFFEINFQRAQIVRVVLLVIVDEGSERFLTKVVELLRADMG